MKFAALAIYVELAALAAFPLVPIAVLCADNLGRLPRWARWMETQDRPGWLGPMRRNSAARLRRCWRWLAH